MSLRPLPPGAVRPEPCTVDPMTSREIARRWRRYQRAIFLLQGSPWRAALLTLLPPDTRRYQWAQRVVGHAPVTAPASGPTEEHVHLGDDPVPADVTVLAWTAEQPGAAAAAAEQFAAVTTEFVAFLPALDHLGAITAALRADIGEASMVASDEIIDGVTWTKPAAITELALRAGDLVGGPVLWRTAALHRVGGLRPERGPAMLVGLALDLLDQGLPLRTSPRRLPGGRTWAQLAHPDYADAVATLFAERGVTVTTSTYPRRWRATTAAPTVEILIPTRDRADLVAACLDALADTDYPHLSVTIIDNDSVEPATAALFAERAMRVVAAPGPFNYARLMNLGVAASEADYVVTMNNDLTVHGPHWLRDLMDVATDPSVGVVGCVTTTPDGHRDHESIVIAPYPVHAPGTDHPAGFVRPVSAVTGALQVVRRSLWNEVGGMDESLAVTCNDVDLCLRTQAWGALTVTVPHVRVTHRVSASRGRLDPRRDRERFLARWDILRTFIDPYVSSGLAMAGPRTVARVDFPPLGP